MYYLYHIPGKKIGITRNLNSRVTRQQGYAADEYEVLLTSDDIDFISAKELELQKSYGYKVDRQSYKNLIKSNTMNINATEQTSTFPCPLNKLKGRLMDNLDLSWDTSLGEFKITPDKIPWIIKNARESMYNKNRCYIYNKAFHEAFLNSNIITVDTYEVNGRPSNDNDYIRFEAIRNWAKDRGIYDKGNSHTQYVKLMEEAGELAAALLNKDMSEIVDAIGDMVVVLTNLAELEGVKIEDCIDVAYNVIAKRKGKMINGTFVKEQL